MKRIDTFPFNNELDMLECRLTELDGIVDYFILVEADRTHGHNEPKPLHYAENAERFAPWADRIIHVVASDLPDAVDPWSREHGQREWIWEGLKRLDAQPDDIVMQSDVDEIPAPLQAQMINPRGFCVFSQRLHCFAVDWLHPEPWRGTVAGRVKDIGKMAAMRDARNWAPIVLEDAGWHLSWLGGEDAANAKMRSFCHPEIEPQWSGKLGDCYRNGLHVDGTKMQAVTVDNSWPRWIAEGHAPKEWFRP